MAVISIFSPKGGAGKTTVSLLLGLGLAKRGHDITMIDADPNSSLSMWQPNENSPQNLTVTKQSAEDEIAQTIMTAHNDGHTVIVDLDGRASTRATYALMLSDLVLVPFRGSMLDADLAARAQTQIRSTEMARGRAIPYRGVLTNTPASLAFYSRALKNVLTILKAMPFPMLKTAVAERQAYRELFSFGGALESLPTDEVPGLLQATQNANALTLEVERILLGKEHDDE